MTYSGNRNNILQRGADGTGFDDLIRVHYTKPIQTMLREETELYNLLSKSKVKMSGNEWRVPFRDGDRLAGVGARGENARLPLAGRMKSDYLTFYVTRCYGVAQMDNFSKAVFRATGEADMLFNDVRTMTEDLQLSAKEHMDMSFFGDGTGVRAVIDGTQIAANINTNGYIAIKSHFLSQDSKGASLSFRPGDRFAVYTGTFPSSLTLVGPDWQTAVVDHVDTVNGRLYLDGFTAVNDLADGDYIVWGADQYGDSMGEDIYGLSRVFEFHNSSALDTSPAFTWGGKTKSDRIAYRPWRSNVATPAFFDLTELAREMRLPRAHRRGKITDIYVNSAVVDEFSKQIDGAFMMEKFDFNYKKNANMISIPMGDSYVPMHQNEWVPYGWAIGLNRDSWKYLQLEEWTFDDTGGILKPVTGYDQSVMYMRWYGNVYCDLPASNAATRITVDTGNLAA